MLAISNLGISYFISLFFLSDSTINDSPNAILTVPILSPSNEKTVL
jgi:hypothetical protein